jgi:colanic acid/amylovoran biosynthesis glycosyltransferase
MQSKVFYLTGEFPRPTDTWIQREINNLRHLGVDIRTFAVRRPLQGPVSFEQEQHLKQTTYLVEELKSTKLLTCQLKAGFRSPKRYLGTLRLAWQTKRPGFKGLFYQMAYFAEATILADHLKTNKANHLHNHFGDSSATVAMLAANLAGVNYSFTLHGPGIFFEPYLWRLDKKIEKAKFVSCISFFCRSQAAIFSRPEDIEKLKIIHCGVEPNKLKATKHEDVTTKQILFVARLEELKGVGDLLRANQQQYRLQGEDYW